MAAGVSGLELLLERREFDTTSDVGIVLTFAQKLIENIYASVLDYKTLIDSNWHNLYCPRADWAKFCKIAIFLLTVRQYISELGENARTANPDGYYNMLKDALEKQELYILEDEDEIIGAMIMNNECIESYDSVPWQIDAPPEKVSIIHAFGVTPAMHGKGAAKVMIENAFELAHAKNQAAIRLDALAHNIPAQKFYSKSGFTHVQTLKMYYEDTGWTDFKLYEYVLCHIPVCRYPSNSTSLNLLKKPPNQLS
jgi:ribosomal protein S18 acetylase RimI-like enzyme